MTEAYLESLRKQGTPKIYITLLERVSATTDVPMKVLDDICGDVFNSEPLTVRKEQKLEEYSCVFCKGVHTAVEHYNIYRKAEKILYKDLGRRWWHF